MTGWWTSWQQQGTRLRRSERQQKPRGVDKQQKLSSKQRIYEKLGASLPRFPAGIGAPKIWNTSWGGRFGFLFCTVTDSLDIVLWCSIYSMYEFEDVDMSLPLWPSHFAEASWAVFSWQQLYSAVKSWNEASFLSFHPPFFLSLVLKFKLFNKTGRKKKGNSFCRFSLISLTV